jgi:Stealth protein CR2, conserved region 2
MSANPRPGYYLSEPIDVVYTWVDDQQPGYRDLLQQHSQKKHDSDPARTRDNLETLRFSMRSLELYAPWVNRVFLLTCRPQVPSWLETSHPRLTVVHHDEVMNAELLPTFNSFGIICHLHRIPGLSQKFVYLEDDMLFLAPTTLDDFVSPDGLTWVFEEKHMAPRLDQIADPQGTSGWNMALAHSNRLLDQRFGEAVRHQVNHVPLLIDKTWWEQTLNMFPEALECTFRSRFRSQGNFAPEYLYPQCLLAQGKARLANRQRITASSGYVPLEDFWPVTAWRLWQVKRNQPKWATLNDNFGKKPSVITESIVRRGLQAWFPTRCAFERA